MTPVPFTLPLSGARRKAKGMAPSPGGSGAYREEAKGRYGTWFWDRARGGKAADRARDLSEMSSPNAVVVGDVQRRTAGAPQHVVGRIDNIIMIEVAGQAE